jgi:hypothetical protein
MSDISTFVKRGHNDHEAINKLQALITPIAFPEPEESSQKERVILSSPVRLRTLTSSTGTDITTTNSETKDRFSNSYTVVPDTSSKTAYPVSNTTTGTLTFNSSSQIKGGAGVEFTGSQYITIPDNAALESDLPIGIMFTFKSNGTEGVLAVYCKKDESTSTNAGVYVELLRNSVADFDQTGPNFDSGDFNTTTQASAVRVHVADGTNEVDATITTATDLFDGSVHTVVINIANTNPDFDSGDFDNDDFYIANSPKTVEVFVDKVSEGTADTSSITGSLANARDAYFGGRDNGSGVDSKLQGYVALFEIQNSTYNTTAINAYNDDNRIYVTNQLNALHFAGTEDPNVLDDMW